MFFDEGHATIPPWQRNFDNMAFSVQGATVCATKSPLHLKSDCDCTCARERAVVFLRQKWNSSSCSTLVEQSASEVAQRKWDRVYEVIVV